MDTYSKHIAQAYSHKQHKSPYTNTYQMTDVTQSMKTYI